MESWTRTGPVVVEVDGQVDGRRIVDYACREAMRSGAELVLAAPYQPYELLTSDRQSPRDALRTATAWVRQLAGTDLRLGAVAVEGSRLQVLARVARNARQLVVGRTPVRRPQRLVTAHGNIFLTARTGCPVVVVPTSWRPSELDQKVAVGIDGTELSLEAAEFAFQAAGERRGELTVVHAQHTPRDHRDGVGLSVQETLAGWAEKYPRVKLTRFLTSRPVVEALVQEGAQAGLVIVGAPAGALPIGDPVARQAVSGLSCPVAVVPHHVVAPERIVLSAHAAQSAENPA
ncbi:universal stress protein [Kribbella sancticallisti]|uniref:Universal stress protein n=1 Tax=Kribbella sancticallisti TaxID=460087 RepID=A0ABP4NZ50_9ACTN